MSAAGPNTSVLSPGTRGSNFPAVGASFCTEVDGGPKCIAFVVFHYDPALAVVVMDQNLLFYVLVFVPQISEPHTPIVRHVELFEAASLFESGHIIRKNTISKMAYAQAAVTFAGNQDDSCGLAFLNLIRCACFTFLVGVCCTANFCRM